MRDLKNNLSRYLDRVQAGQEVVVTDRGRPVARLTAMTPAADRLAELIWDAADTLSSARPVTVEARAALAAPARGGCLTAAQARHAQAEMAWLIDELAIIETTAALVDQAADLADEEALRGCDAVHLAAALTIGAVVLSSADGALCAAAGRRGLHVANPRVRPAQLLTLCTRL